MRAYKIVLTAFFILAVAQAFSQADSVGAKHRIIISALSGMAVPMGDFASYERDNNNSYYLAYNIAGEAKLGLNLKIDGRYLFSKNFGAVLILSSTVHKVTDASSYMSLGESDAGLGYIGPISATYNSNSWYTYNALTGFCAEFGNNTITFMLSVSGGYQQVECPETRVEATGYSYAPEQPVPWLYKKSIVQPKLVSNNFVVNGGFALRIKVIKKLSVTTGFDYLTSKASFNAESHYSYHSTRGTSEFNYEKTTLFSFDKHISVLCFTAGVSYRVK